MGIHDSISSAFQREEFPDLVPSDDSSDKLGNDLCAKRRQCTKIGALDKTLSRIYPNRLRTAELSIHTNSRYGDLYQELLKARKRIFIDQKGWGLSDVDGMEFDQYDTPQSISVVIHDFGEVLAGIRLMPTKARCGCYSYMLRDAQRGLLEDIPSNILYERAPVADHIWEATRLFVAADVPAERRSLVQAHLMTEMAIVAVQHGASHVIGIVPAVFRRWMARIGLSALPLGPKIVIDGDKIQAAVMHVSQLAMQSDQQTYIN
ncbi:acyl-homoserine-lactone synthase [Roseivivax sp. CAU 1753]